MNKENNNTVIYAVVYWSDEEEPSLRIYKTESVAHDVFSKVKQDGYSAYLDIWYLSEVE